MTRPLITLLLMLIAITANAEQIQLEDGRTIELHKDGTWTYLSRDRLLATPDGRQVRVREDGTWEYTGDLAPEPDQGGDAASRALLGDMMLFLKILAIETSRSSNHKNKSKKTQTVFEVNLVNNGEQAAKIALDRETVRVEDSGGREYEVLQVTPGALNLAPGEKAVLEVRADGSPHWFTTRAMELHISREAGEDVVLRGMLADARKRELKEP